MTFQYSQSTKVVSAVLALTALGFCVGAGLQSVLITRISDGVFTRWQAQGAPPEPVAQLLGIGWEGGADAVYVETVSGQVYWCCARAPQPWVAVAPHPTGIFSQPACAEMPARAPQPPGPIVACAEAATFEYTNERIQYALLADGTVWRWFYHVGLDTSLTIVGGGLLAGSLLGVLLAWALTRKSEAH